MCFHRGKLSNCCETWCLSDEILLCVQEDLQLFRCYTIPFIKLILMNEMVCIGTSVSLLERTSVMFDEFIPSMTIVNMCIVIHYYQNSIRVTMSQKHWNLWCRRLQYSSVRLCHRWIWDSLQLAFARYSDSYYSDIFLYSDTEIISICSALSSNYTWI